MTMTIGKGGLARVDGGRNEHIQFVIHTRSFLDVTATR